MRGSTIVFVIVPFLFLNSSSSANDQVANIFYTGECQNLTIVGKNMTSGCGNSIAQSTYDNGRIGFTASIGADGTTISFSGYNIKNIGTNNYSYSIDRIILNLNIEGVSPSETNIRGECSYSNLNLAPSRIFCHANDHNNLSSSILFITEGRLPKITNSEIDEIKVDQIPYGSRMGMNVTVTSKTGINTAHAKIGIKHTKQNAREYCTEYLLDESELCVQKTLKQVKIPKQLNANCKNKTWTSTDGQKYKFLGRNKDPLFDAPEYSILSIKNNRKINDVAGSGYNQAIATLKLSCPIIFN